ncbi:MAG: ABC transporter ATP-binding protein [Bacilli bacterium]
MLFLEKVCVAAKERTILRDVSFAVASGSIHGLIGRNGAGKSTTVRAILGLQPLNSGTIRVLGRTLAEDPAAYKSPLAYIPELPMLYQGLTVTEYLQFTAMAYNVPEAEFRKRLPLLLERFDMSAHAHDIPLLFSKGMRQKMNVMAALIHDGRVFVVDEPFIGLDPIAIRALKEELRAVADHDGCVLLTTHALDIAEAICDSFTVLEQGQVLTTGSGRQLRDEFGVPADASLEDVYMKVLGNRGANS